MDDHSHNSLDQMPPEEFLCPGDRQPISKSLHLARLAAGHRACRDCQYRSMTGSLPSPVTKRLQRTSHEATFVLDADESIRGLYINELTRERMERIVRVLVELVEVERLAEADGVNRSHRPLRVLTGFDRRPDSPDLSIGVVQALRQSPIEIIDLGEVSRPMVDFAIDRYCPDLGIYVTGGLRPAAWTGIDLIDASSLPWFTPERQFAFTERFSPSLATENNAKPIQRLNNVDATIAGRYQSLDVSEDYESAIASRFHALRPLRIGITCAEVGLISTLRKLLSRTPCDVRYLPVGSSGSAERNLKALPDQVCEYHLDLGLAIARDGRGCQFFDETGTELSADDLATLLLLPYRELSGSQRERPRLIREQCADERTRRIEQRTNNVPVIVDEAGRCWFLDESPACDAIQTLARVLEVLSLSERSLSSTVREGKLLASASLPHHAG